MTSFADNLRTGSASYNRVSSGPTGYAEDEIYGTSLTGVYFQEMGQVTTTATNAVLTASAGTTAPTLNGTLVSGGVATFGVPRAVQISSTSDLSSQVTTIRGTDKYGATLVSTIATGPNNSTVYSIVAYKTVTAITTATAAAAAYTVGDSDRYGTDYRIANAAKIFSLNKSGVTLTATVGGIVAGFTATGTSTATTADVRGIVIMPTAGLADGTSYLTIGMIVPNWGIAASSDTKENTYGATPYGG